MHKWPSPQRNMLEIQSYMFPLRRKGAIRRFVVIRLRLIYKLLNLGRNQHTQSNMRNVKEMKDLSIKLKHQPLTKVKWWKTPTKLLNSPNLAHSHLRFSTLCRHNIQFMTNSLPCHSNLRNYTLVSCISGKLVLEELSVNIVTIPNIACSLQK